MKRSRSKTLSTVFFTTLVIATLAGLMYVAINAQDKQNHISTTKAIGKNLSDMRSEAKVLETSKGNKHKITQWTVKNLRRPGAI